MLYIVNIQKCVCVCVWMIIPVAAGTKAAIHQEFKLAAYSSIFLNLSTFLHHPSLTFPPPPSTLNSPPPPPPFITLFLLSPPFLDLFPLPPLFSTILSVHQRRVFYEVRALKKTSASGRSHSKGMNKVRHLQLGSRAPPPPTAGKHTLKTQLPEHRQRQSSVKSVGQESESLVYTITRWLLQALGRAYELISIKLLPYQDLRRGGIMTSAVNTRQAGGTGYPTVAQR